MANYAPPVEKLFRIGEPTLENWRNYSTYGIGAEHIPDLIRVLKDVELVRSGQGLEVYGQVHAWRALAQLKAEAAIEPLLDLLAAQENDGEWDDWITEDVPEALGRIGAAALEPASTRLTESFAQQHAPGYYASVLAEIVKNDPSTREEVVRQLTLFLEHATGNDHSVNGFVIGHLMDLEAVEAWPVIEKAFGDDVVDLSILGDADEVKWHFGLGPMPASLIQRRDFGSIKTPLSAKARALKRSRKKKAAKKRHKRSR